jgi:hypothetical protein
MMEIKPYAARTLFVTGVNPSEAELLNPRNKDSPTGGPRSEPLYSVFSDMENPSNTPRTPEKIRYFCPKIPHPLEKTGYGKVMDVVITTGHPHLGDWTMSYSKEVFADVGITIATGKVSYLKTDFHLSALEEAEKELIVKISEATLIAPNPAGSHGRSIIGGAFLKTPNERARLYVKLDNRKGWCDLTIPANHPLGTVSVWHPPFRHNSWWRESSDREVLAGVRAESNRTQHTEDEDMLDTGSDQGDISTVSCSVTTGSSNTVLQDTEPQDSKPPASNSTPVLPDPPVVRSAPVKSEDASPPMQFPEPHAPMASLQHPQKNPSEITTHWEDGFENALKDNDELQVPSEIFSTHSTAPPQIPEQIPPAENEYTGSNSTLSDPSESFETQDSTQNTRAWPAVTGNFEFELTYCTEGQRFSVKRTIDQSGAPASNGRRKQSHLTTIRTLQAQFARRPPLVATTEMLPHILFPVGHLSPGQSLKTCPSVRALLDTGSGLNIGYEPYWRSVSINHPDIVREFGKWSDEMDSDLTIGGIDRHGEATSCTHYIVLKTPFVDMGREVDLRIALSDSLSCNLIFGIPFQIRSNMVIHTAEKYVVSTVFKTTFPLFYHPPELRENVIVQTGTPLALSTGRKA